MWSQACGNSFCRYSFTHLPVQQPHTRHLVPVRASPTLLCPQHFWSSDENDIELFLNALNLPKCQVLIVGRSDREEKCAELTLCWDIMGTACAFQVVKSVWVKSLSDESRSHERRLGNCSEGSQEPYSSTENMNFLLSEMRNHSMFLSKRVRRLIWVKTLSLLLWKWICKVEDWRESIKAGPWQWNGRGKFEMHI